MVDIDCAGCGREIRACDQVIRGVDTPHPDADYVSDVDPNLRGRSDYWRHVCCSKEGMERWNRLNRPHNDPVLWMRLDKPNWTDFMQPPIRWGHWLHKAEEFDN